MLVQPKTYVEALRSPRTETVKSKRGGWKIQVSPKQGGQLTLQAAFDAGKLIQEAKSLKRKALNNQDPVEVGYINFRPGNVILL